MANIQELQDAFMRAHRAGDEKNARILANALKQQLSQREEDVDALPPELRAPEAAVAQPESGFLAGLKSGWESLRGDISAGQAAILGTEGAEAEAAAHRKRAGELYKQPEFTEHPVDYVTGLLGQSIPYMVAPVVAGGAAAVAAPEIAAAGLLGAGATSAAQFTGSNISRQLEEGVAAKDVNVTNAVLSAIPQAALDTASMRMIPGLRGILGQAGIELTEAQAAKVARDGLIGTTVNAVKAYGPGTLKTAGTEGLTEAAQQVLERAQAGLSITDPEARQEYYDNFLGGAILGGTLAPVGLHGERAEARDKYAEIDRKKAAEEAKAAAEKEAAYKQTDEYMLKLDQDFSTLVDQKKALLEQRNELTGGKKKLPKDATPEQADQYDALTQQLKDTERQLYSMGPEIGKNKDRVAAIKEEARKAGLTPQQYFLEKMGVAPEEEVAALPAEQVAPTMADLVETPVTETPAAEPVNEAQTFLDSKLEGLRYHNLINDPAEVVDVLASDKALANSFLNGEVSIPELNAKQTKLVKTALPLHLEEVQKKAAPEMEAALQATETQRKVEAEKEALQRIAATPTPVATTPALTRGLEAIEKKAEEKAPAVKVEEGVTDYNAKADEFAAANKEAETKLTDIAESLAVGRFLNSPVAEERKNAKSTKEGLQRQAEAQKQAYIDSVLHEAANRRAAEQLQPISTAAANDATKQISNLLDSVVNQKATFESIQRPLAAIKGKLAVSTPPLQKGVGKFAAPQTTAKPAAPAPVKTTAPTMRGRVERVQAAKAAAKENIKAEKTVVKAKQVAETENVPITEAKHKVIAQNFAKNSAVVKQAKERFGENSKEALKAEEEAHNFFLDALSKHKKEAEDTPPSGFDKPAFRLGNPAANPVDAAEAQALIDKVKAGLPSSVKLVYAKSLQNLPGKVVVSMAKAGMDVHSDRVKGAVMPDGTVIIIGDTHESIADLEKTIAHELVGHYGVDAMLGEPGMKALLKAVENFEGGMIGMAEKLGVAEEVQETALEYAKRYDAAKANGATKEELNKILQEGKIQALREMIAHVEESRADKGFVGKAKEFIQALVGALRNAFKKMGLTDLSTASTSDIFYLLRESRKSIKDKTVGFYQNPHGEPVFRREKVSGPKVSDSVSSAVDKIVAGPQTTADRIRSAASGIGNRTMYIDRLAPMERVAEHLKKSAQAMQMLYYGRMHDQRNTITGETINNGAPTLVVDDKGNYVIKSRGGANLMDISKLFSTVKGYGNAEKVRDLFTAWLAAKRAKNPGVGKEKLNFNENVTQRELDEVEALGDKIPEFAEARKLYNEYNDGLIDWLKQSGTIDEKTFEKLTSLRDYVPYYRAKGDNVVMEIAGVQPFKIGNLQQQPYLKELIGGDEKIQDFFTSSLQNTAMLVDMGLRNLATKEIFFSLQEAGLLQGKQSKRGGMVYMIPGHGPSQPNVIRFSKNGMEYHAVVESEALGIPSELLVKGLQGTPTVIGGVTKMMAIPARWLRAMITRSPVYMIRQLLRDSTTNFLLAGGDMLPVASASKELLKMYQGKSTGERALQERGIIGGQILSGTSEDMQKLMLQLSKGASGWETALAKLDRASMKSDAAARVTLYNSYRSQGLSDMEATLATLESMNFSKRGASGSLYAMNMMIPFLNAQIQGLDVLYKAFTGKLPYAEKTQAQRKLYARGALLAGMTLAYAAMMEDDDAYKNASMRDRLGNWFIRIPGFEDPIKIPIPFEAGLIFKALPEAVVEMNRKDRDMGEVMKGLAQLTATSVPFGPSSVPQAVKPILEASINKSFFTGQDIESTHEKELMPGERTRDKTSGVAKLLGSSIGVSPVMVDHLINGYTGGLGLAIAQAAGTMLPLKEGPSAPEKRLADMPVIGSMFQPSNATGQISLFYDKATQFTQAKNTLDKMMSEGRVDEAKEFAKDYGKEIALADVAESFKNTLSEFTEMERLVKASSLSPEEKQKRLKEIRGAKIEFSRSFNAASRQS